MGRGVTGPRAPRAYVLDTGIVCALQRAGHLSVLGSLSEKATLVLLEEVVDELVDVPPKHAKLAEQVRGLLRSSGIRQESIDAGSPGAVRLSTLRAGKTSDADMGEAASIAWAAEELDAVFVTRDQEAALRGLEELRGRTLGLFGWIAELVEGAILDGSVARQIGEDVVTAPFVSARPPLWWREWLDNQASNDAPARGDTTPTPLAKA